MRLRCLLIDDEPPALKVLTTYINSIEGLEIAGQCKNAIEALDVLQKKIRGGAIGHPNGNKGDRAGFRFGKVRIQ